MLRRLGLITLVGLAACNDSGSDINGTSNCDACGGDCQVESFTIGDRQHTLADVDYETLPPPGGPHDPCWVPWAIYDQPIRTERWVHNLEHGGLVFLYDCPEGCAADVATLTAFVSALPPGRAVMAPYPDMDSRIAAVAWGARLTLGCVDTEALQSFYDASVSRAPEDLTVNPAGCPAP